VFLPLAERYFFRLLFFVFVLASAKTKNTKMGSSGAITAGNEPDSSGDRVSRVTYEASSFGATIITLITVQVY
jgi:hypothetical protein